MHAYAEMSQEITNEAIDLHNRERRLTIESIRLIAKLYKLAPWSHLNMTIEKYAYFIGLTPSKFYKRLQVARTFRMQPRVLKMYENGETTISHIALISGRITDANAAVLMDGIRNKSKREVEEFICRVTPRGEILAKQDTFELTMRFTLEQRELLDRAREVLAHGGHVPSNAQVVEAALNELLKHKDPMRKAERAAARAAKNRNDAEREIDAETQATKSEVGESEHEGQVDSDREDQPWGTFDREAIPAAHRHAVWLRDKGQCTYLNSWGGRCDQKMMLEIDHIRMVCRGGGNEISNLRLRCRYHNQIEVRQEDRYSASDCHEDLIERAAVG